MEDRINSVSEMCGGCCVRVWEVSAINRFIYASSVQQPNARLLGTDSEYSSIKRSSHTRLTHPQTHMYNDFCQSHADVQSIPAACHKCSERGGQAEQRGDEWPQMYSKLLLLFDFVSSDNLAVILRELNTSVQQRKEKLHLLRFRVLCAADWVLTATL